MGELGAFLKIHRVGFDKRDPRQRVRDYRQYFGLQPDEELRRQGARCMDCGIPFCHEGCPLGNLIPDWNDLVYRGKWREAADQLHMTNNFPEFTGRICPAPCESACVLAINDDPVAIEQIEMAIAERAFSEGWVVAEPPARRSGKSVGVIGSGPAGPEPTTATVLPVRRVGGSATTQPSWKARSAIAISICSIATGSSLMASTQADSHGAGQISPVNSGKLLVVCSWSIASRHLSR